MTIPRYKELDALRGFAALFVVFFHYTTHTRYSFRFLELGVTGVDLFFIISGFVIFMSINKISSGKEFIINRFARLYPTYLASVSFTTLLCVIVNHFYFTGQSISIYQYLANMSMFQHYLRAENIDGTYWTMIIEMVFYIFILFLFQFKIIKYILPICISLLCFTILIDVWVENYFVFLYKAIRYVFPLINHLPLFFAGILFYKIANSNKIDYKYYVLLLFCLAVQIMLYDNGGSAQKYINQWNYSFMLVFYFMLFILFVNNKLSFIVNRPALFFGKISFALYLIHQYLSIDVIIPILTKQAGFNFWVSALIAFIISVTLSTLITFYIEIPFGKKIKSLFLKRIIINENTN